MVFNKTGRLWHNPFHLGNVKLENVRLYKYLGLLFTPSGEIKSALEDMRARALKAYWGLKHILGICFNTYPKETIKLFDATITPILLYGSDFWGCLTLPKNNPIENVHLMFCKHLLGVHKNTTTNGVLLELGRVPLVLHAQKASIKNWERLKSGKSKLLQTLSFTDGQNYSLDWIDKIKKCLSEIGMYYLFLNNEYPAIQRVHDKVFKRQSDIFFQNVFSNISTETSKLRTYNLVKTNTQYENYLTKIRNFKRRQTLSRFRLSDHDLMIEVGRYKNIPKSERFCQFCTGIVEDEIHFLVRCKSYNTQRKILFDYALKLRPNFLYDSDIENFIYLLSCEDMCNTVAVFIWESMQQRKFLMGTSS